MADIVSKAVRSRMMSGIRNKDTRPEMIVRRALHRAGLRYRLHDTSLPGRPDIVLPRRKTAVQVRGCFWHQHRGCRFAYMPATNRRFWKAKLEANVARDRLNDRRLRELGWSVLTVWECETGDERRLERLVSRIQSRST